jgi:hypothetical protein
MQKLNFSHQTLLRETLVMVSGVRFANVFVGFWKKVEKMANTAQGGIDKRAGNPGAAEFSRVRDILRKFFGIGNNPLADRGS